MGAGGSATILGVRVDRLTLAEAAEATVGLIRRAAARRGSGGGASLVFTPNPEILARARRDAALRNALNAADLLVADGIGVVWASRVLGRPVPERVSGFDLLVALLAGAGGAREPEGGAPQPGAEGLRVFFLGGRPGVAAEAAAAVRRRFPGANVVGEHHGYFADDAEVLAEIRRCRPDLLVVGMGSPKQEMWLAKHRAALGGLVAMGAGGSLDVLSARTRRAPSLVRRLNLEWAYRILSEPRARFRRVPGLVAFVLAVAGEALRGRRARPRRREGPAGGDRPAGAEGDLAAAEGEGEAK